MAELAIAMASVPGVSALANSEATRSPPAMIKQKLQQLSLNARGCIEV